MTRILLAFLFLSFACAPAAVFAERAAAPTETPTALPWGSPKHEHFFRYQVYLDTVGLRGFSPDSWVLLLTPERQEEVAKGEEVVKKRYEGLLESEHHTPDDIQFLEIVWGESIAKQVAKVVKARKTKDPGQIKIALKEVGSMSEKIGGIGKKVAWNNLFDGADAYTGDTQNPGEKDYLATEKRDDFLASLESPETQKILSSQKSFHNFLKSKSVASAAMPSLMAMYGVLTKAEGQDREETKHLLPTVVRLLNDGKKITADAQGALGYAYPGDYDRPEAIKVMANADKVNPLVVGKTMAHETQHIYDMYTGRYYTLDSELRGFKVAVLYFGIIEKTAPKKYEELLNSDNDKVRSIVQDARNYAQAYEKGPSDFARAVAFGHGYNSWHEGVFQGRVPLREAVDEKLGAPRQLAAQMALRDEAKARVDKLERREQELLLLLDGDSSRTIDRELEKVSRDLRNARWFFTEHNKAVTVNRIRIKRMRSEVEWLDKKAKGASPEPYDLHLPVDKEYLVP